MSAGPELVTVGIDVGSSAVKTAVIRSEGGVAAEVLALRTDRIRRRELTKVAGHYAENARIAVRNVRRDGMDQIKKAKSDGMSEDDQKFWEIAVQELTDAGIAKIDSSLESKQEEIMQV